MKPPKKTYRQKNASENGVAAVKNLIAQLGIAITPTSIEESLLEHPDYPSLYAISDVLSDWSVESMNVKLNPEHLEQIDYPAIAHLNKNDGHFVVLTKFTNNTISYIDPKIGKQQLPLADFLQQWDGLTVLVETNDNSGDPQYEINRKAEQAKQLRTPIIGGLILILFSLFVMAGMAHPSLTLWRWAPPLALKLTGSVVAVLLVLELFQKENPLLKKLCNLGKKTSCANVLSSKGAYLFGMISLSELSAFYFLGGTLAIGLCLFTNNPLFVLWSIVAVNLLALPFTLYSIYFQGVVLKQWCPLCLGIVGILWVEAIFNLTLSDWKVQQVTWSGIGILITGYALPTLIWITLRSAVFKAAQVTILKRNLAKYTRNVQVFHTLLSQQKPLTTPNVQPEITLGNPNAPVELMVMLSPTCPVCSQAYREITHLIKDQSNAIKVVIHMAFKEETSDISYQVAATILELAAQQQYAKVDQALTSWYDQQEIADYEKWRSQLSNPESKLEAGTPVSLMEAHKNWRLASGITQAPAFFINKLPVPDQKDWSAIKRYLVYLVKQHQPQTAE